MQNMTGSIWRGFTVTLMALAGLIAVPHRTHAQTPQRNRALRRRMVDDFIAAEGVTNSRVLEALRTVPRHEFVRPSLQHLAYYDQALDIGYKQTISPPFIVAYMTEVLDPQPTDRVLEIGTGSGYQAAVLSGLVEDVYTIEIVEPLGKQAAATLRKLGYDNVHCRIGDGYLGWPEQAPFDKIIVTCSPEDVPAPLIEQLKDGGRMIIPLGERYQQVFHLFQKENGELKQKKLLPTLFVPMTGKMEELRALKPDPAHPHFVNGDFESDQNSDGRADGWHYQRRCGLSDDAIDGHNSQLFQNDEPGRTAQMLQAMAIDGSIVSELDLQWKMKSEDIHRGPSPTNVPGLVVYFFDSRRIPIERVAVGPWLQDLSDWSSARETIPVPEAAREAIVQVGLNGATGRLWLDDISLQPVR